jgi:hypothetical protein
MRSVLDLNFEGEEHRYLIIKNNDRTSMSLDIYKEILEVLNKDELSTLDVREYSLDSIGFNVNVKHNGDVEFKQSDYVEPPLYKISSDDEVGKTFINKLIRINDIFKSKFLKANYRGEFIDCSDLYTFYRNEAVCLSRNLNGHYYMKLGKYQDVPFAFVDNKLSVVTGDRDE